MFHSLKIPGQVLAKPMEFQVETGKCYIWEHEGDTFYIYIHIWREHVFVL